MDWTGSGVVFFKTLEMLSVSARLQTTLCNFIAKAGYENFSVKALYHYHSTKIRICQEGNF
ncbi:MAG: hypothetical protein IKI37_07840 [Oscillospiraceae bacterium]|nr:hypothetical protein [Oscillospiraceae bacterium]